MSSKVYLVSYGYQDEYRVEAVCSTREKADAYAERANRLEYPDGIPIGRVEPFSYEVEEWDMDADGWGVQMMLRRTNK